MKKFLVSVFVLCAFLCFAEPPKPPKGPNPDIIFGFIAKDLRLSDEQKTKLDEIKANIAKCHKNTSDAKLDEVKQILVLLEKDKVTDEDINVFEKKSFENEVDFHFGMATQMRAFYNMLDEHQKHIFIDKITPHHKKHNGKYNRHDKHHGDKRDFRKHDARGFHDCHCEECERHNDRRQHDFHGRDFGRHDNKKPHDFKGKGDKKFRPDGHHGFFMHPMQHGINLNKQNLLNKAFAFELNLTKEQRDLYMKIKDEVKQKRAETFTKEDIKKEHNFVEILSSSDTDEQIKNNISEKLQKAEDCNLFLLHKYFEFVNILTSEQKDVLILKYKYDIAKMSLRKNNE